MKQRLSYLDGLRGYTCLLVAFLHLGSLFFYRMNKYLGDTTQLGGYAPYLFFLLSGFSVALSLSRKDTFNFKNYIFRRMTTFIPIYFFLIVISFFIIRPTFPGNNDLGGLLTHLTFTNFNFINPLWVRSLMNLEWTQPFMFWFYFIIPSLFLLSRSSVYFRFILVIFSLIIYLPLTPRFPYESLMAGIYDSFRRTFVFYVFGVSLLLYVYEQKKPGNLILQLLQSFPVFLFIIFLILFPAANQNERLLLTVYVLYSSLCYGLSRVQISKLFPFVAYFAAFVINIGFIFVIAVTRRYILKDVDIPLMFMLFAGTLLYASVTRPSFLSRVILENRVITFIGKISYPLFLVQLLVAYILNKNSQIALFSTGNLSDLWLCKSRKERREKYRYKMLLR